MRWQPLLVALVLAGCGRSSGPVAPSAPPAPAPPPVSEVTGVLRATISGRPLAGASLAFDGRVVTSGADGRFAISIERAAGVRAATVNIDGPGIVPRVLSVDIRTSRDLSLDAISLADGFDLDYYRKLVRDTADEPDQLRPLRRWTRAPRVYLKTVDEAGHPIDERTLASTHQALGDEAASWTGQRFGVAEIALGTESREGQTGWITVKWPNPSIGDDICGRAQIAVDGGWIELNYLNPDCDCMGSAVAPGTVRHEIGHALGFFHTHEPEDLLSYTRSHAMWCNGRPSARERFHAAIAYSRLVGNVDPDVDPGATLQRHALEPIVIVD